MIITLGGRAGTGKSSVGRALANAFGYRFYSAGDARRKYATDHGMSLAELNRIAEHDPASDRLVDEYLETVGMKEDDFVLDARLGFYFIPHSAKVFLSADDHVRAKRTFEKSRQEEQPKDLEEALRIIDERENSDYRRYQKLYGVNASDPKNFDIWIDTSSRSVEETTALIHGYAVSPVSKNYFGLIKKGAGA